MNVDYNKAQQILHDSTILIKQEQIEKQITILANLINENIGDNLPTFLTVMNGGMFFASKLLSQITKPFMMDYIHATRYQSKTFGLPQITWLKEPKKSLIEGRDVYIIDDILDEGHTLHEITHYLHNLGAKSCKIIVLVEKELNKAKPIHADYVGLMVPNKYIFGYGMDIFELYRQLPNIYIYNS